MKHKITLTAEGGGLKDNCSFVLEHEDHFDPLRAFIAAVLPRYISFMGEKQVITITVEAV